MFAPIKTALHTDMAFKEPFNEPDPHEILLKMVLEFVGDVGVAVLRYEQIGDSKIVEMVDWIEKHYKPKE